MSHRTRLGLRVALLPTTDGNSSEGKMTAQKIIEPDYDAEMKLPDGKSCDDCIHSKRCFSLGFSVTQRKSCDFWPSRFRPGFSGIERVALKPV